MTSPIDHAPLPASAYPEAPVLAWLDKTAPEPCYEYGILIPLQDQHFYDCEVCSGPKAVVVWGEDCIAECADCLNNEDEKNAPSILAERAK